MGGHSKPKHFTKSATNANGPTPIATTGQVKSATSQPNNTSTSPATNTAVPNHKKRKPKINLTIYSESDKGHLRFNLVNRLHPETVGRPTCLVPT
jgi:hypothetical protein